LNNLHQSAIVALTVYKQFGQWISLDSNIPNIKKEIQDLFQEEKEIEKEEVPIKKEVLPDIEEDPFMEPRYGIIDALECNEKFVDVVHNNKLNYIEQRLKFYAMLYTRTRDPDIWHTRAQYAQDLLLAGSDDRFNPKKVKEAEDKDKIESHRYLFIRKELNALQKYHANPSNPGTWYVEDPSSDEEQGFDIFDFDEDLKDSQAKEPDRFLGHFPFDNG